jgi:hypothetical protein
MDPRTEHTHTAEGERDKKILTLILVSINTYNLMTHSAEYMVIEDQLKMK